MDLAWYLIDYSAFVTAILLPFFLRHIFSTQDSRSRRLGEVFDII
jgi:hypothetical protein